MQASTNNEIKALFSTGVKVAAGEVPSDGEGAYDLLFEVEKEQLQRSVDKRRREFAAGRVLAREALSQLGKEPLPLLNRADRAPQWPEHVVGSITHTRGLCIVVAATDQTHLGLGIDAEPLAPLRERLFGHICTEQERSALAAGPLADAGLNARLIFSAKEAFYKCQYALTETYLGFHDVDVALETDGFTVTVREAVPPLFEAGGKLRGRYITLGDHVVTACELLAK